MRKRINMIIASAMFKKAVLAGVALIGLGSIELAQGQQTCAYVNDNLPTANSVEGYRVGTKATHVAPVATGGSGSPTNDPVFFGTPLIAIAPGSTHLYASDSGTSDIALFDIDSASCALRFVARFPSGGSSLFGVEITISQDGKFLYASNADRQSNLVVFPINADGTLGSAVQTLNLPANPSSLVVSPNGKFLIVTRPTAQDQVQSYTIDAARGKVKFASSVTTVAAADGIAIDPHSKFVFVGNGGEGGSAAVQEIEIGAGGKLTFFANVVFNGINNPAGIVGGSNCLLLSPNGKLLFFTNQRTAQVISLNVDDNAGLTFNSIVSDGEGFAEEPSQMASDPARGLIFTGDFNTQGPPAMGVLRASGNGSLKLLGTLPLADKAAATSIAAVTF